MIAGGHVVAIMDILKGGGGRGDSLLRSGGSSFVVQGLIKVLLFMDPPEHS